MGIILNKATGIFNTTKNTIEVNIYPNPANEFVNIESNEKIISIEIYDVQGKLVFNSYVNDFNFTLNVQEFISNIYLVKIKTDLNIYQEKLLIK